MVCCLKQTSLTVCPVSKPVLTGVQIDWYLFPLSRSRSVLILYWFPSPTFNSTLSLSGCVKTKPLWFLGWIFEERSEHSPKVQSLQMTRLRAADKVDEAVKDTVSPARQVDVKKLSLCPPLLPLFTYSHISLFSPLLSH